MNTRLPILLLSGLIALHAAPATTQESESLYERERARMVETIRDEARALPGLAGSDGISEPVLDAMRATKRHLFVPERYRGFAYADRPLPIGNGQTISQPLIVAMMTEFARPGPEDTVLEIGTGSGYQAAVLAKLVAKVCTIEIVEPLGLRAAELLDRLGLDNVQVRIGDGYKGWPECGPFDAVIVTAALDHVPQPLIDQLKPGGRLVMPVGEPGGIQKLTVLEKSASGEMTTREHGAVRFVPFTRAEEDAPRQRPEK